MEKYYGNTSCVVINDIVAPPVPHIHHDDKTYLFSKERNYPSHKYWCDSGSLFLSSSFPFFSPLYPVLSFHPSHLGTYWYLSCLKDQRKRNKKQRHRPLILHRFTLQTGLLPLNYPLQLSSRQDRGISLFHCPFALSFPR